MKYTFNDLSCWGQSELIDEVLRLQQKNNELKEKLKK